MAHPDEVETWDSIYREGEHKERWHYRQPSQELVALIASGAVAPCPSLDIGCGAGVEVVWLAKHRFKAHGIDLSPAAIRLARARAKRAGVRADLRVGDVRELPYAAVTFGLVTDRSCLHTLYRWDWPHYASQVARVMAPGGTLVLRAARSTAGGGFTHMRPQDLSRYFGRSFRKVGLEKISLVTDSGDLPAFLAVLTRK
jgi:SAM-dependent methyltransferase